MPPPEAYIQAETASQYPAKSDEVERYKRSSTVRLTSPHEAKDGSLPQQHPFDEFSQAITTYTGGTHISDVSSSVREVRDSHSVSSEETRGTLQTFSPSPVHPPLPPPLFLPPRTKTTDITKTSDTRRWISAPKPVADVTPSPPLPAPHVYETRPAQPAVARQLSAVKRQARKLANGPSSRASEESPGADVEALESTSGSSPKTATKYYMPKVKVSSPPLWLKSALEAGGHAQGTKGTGPPGGRTRTGSIARTATTMTFSTGNSGGTDASVVSQAIKETPAPETVINPYFSQLDQQEQHAVNQGKESRHGVHERQEGHGDYQHSGDVHEHTSRHVEVRKVRRKISEDLKARILSLPVSEQASKSSKASRHPLQDKAGLSTVTNRILRMQSDRSTYSGRSTHSGRSTPSIIPSVVTTPKIRPGRTLTPSSGKGTKRADQDRHHSQNPTQMSNTARSPGSHSQRWLEQQQQYQHRSSQQSTWQLTGQRARRSQAPSPFEAIERPSHSEATDLSSPPSRSSGASHQSRNAFLDRTERSNHRTTTRRDSETEPLVDSNVASTSTVKTIGNRPPPKKVPNSSSTDVDVHRDGLRRADRERKSTDKTEPSADESHKQHTSPAQSEEIVSRQEELLEEETSGCHHEPGQGIQGLTIVLHLKGQEDLVISTDLTREASGVDGATSVTMGLSPIVPLSSQSFELGEESGFTL